VVTSSGTTQVISGGNGGVAGLAQTFSGNGSAVDLSSLTSAATLASTLGSGGLGISGVVAAGRSLDILLQALESTGRFRVTSRPQVFTSNNKKALIASGQEVAVPATTQSGYGYGTGVNNGLVSTSNIEYKDVFLKLEVQPLINSDNEVTLDIVQEVNSLDKSNTGASTTAGISAPTINSRRIKTTVSIANNATVVLGGLVQETRDDERSGIPILSKIPMLGALFTSKSKSVSRSELIVLIRPTVTLTPADDVKVGERAQEKLNLPPDLEATLDPKGTWENVNKNSKLLRPPKAVLRTEE